MQRINLASYLGRRCQLMVRCDACGGTHVREGTLAVKRPGEIEIDGRTYALAEVRALIPAVAEGDEAPGTAIPRPLFNLAIVSGLALAALTVLRALAG